MFNSSQASNFADDVDFINGLIDQVPDVIVLDDDHKLARAKHLENKDKQQRKHALKPEVSDEEFEDSLPDDDTLKKLLEINSAYKTIEVLGQILKNFPGSIRGSQKFAIMEQCYLLGLRTLGATYDLVRENLDIFVEHLESIWSKGKKDVSRQKFELRAKAVIYALCGMIGEAAIKKVSTSVGSGMLGQTYREVKDRHETNAVALIDLSVKLDHFRSFPEKEVHELNKNLGKNGFAKTMLRVLVARRLYFWPIRYDAKQRVCSKLGIKLTKRELLVDKRLEK